MPRWMSLKATSRRVVAAGPIAPWTTWSPCEPCCVRLALGRPFRRTTWRRQFPLKREADGWGRLPVAGSTQAIPALARAVSELTLELRATPAVACGPGEYAHSVLLLRSPGSARLAGRADAVEQMTVSLSGRHGVDRAGVSGQNFKLGRTGMLHTRDAGTGEGAPHANQKDRDSHSR